MPFALALALLQQRRPKVAATSVCRILIRQQRTLQQRAADFFVYGIEKGFGLRYNEFNESGSGGKKDAD